MSRYREAMLELERLKKEKRQMPPRHVAPPTGLSTSVDTPEVTGTEFGIDPPDVYDEEEDD